MELGVTVSRMRLHHVHLFATDLDQSIAFYTRSFGGEVLADETFAGARNVMMRIGDGRLNFYDQPPPGHGRNAVHHLGIQVEDLQALVDRMTADGYAFRKPIQGVPGSRYTMAEAPDGVLLELFEMNATDPNMPHGAAPWFAWSDNEVNQASPR